MLCQKATALPLLPAVTTDAAATARDGLSPRNWRVCDVLRSGKRTWLRGRVKVNQVEKFKRTLFFLFAAEAWLRTRGSLGCQHALAKPQRLLLNSNRHMIASNSAKSACLV